MADKQSPCAKCQKNETFSACPDTPIHSPPVSRLLQQVLLKLRRKIRGPAPSELIFTHTAHISWEHLEVKRLSKALMEEHRAQGTGPSLGSLRRSAFTPSTFFTTPPRTRTPKNQSLMFRGTILLTRPENKVLPATSKETLPRESWPE